MFEKRLTLLLILILPAFLFAQKLSEGTPADVGFSSELSMLLDAHIQHFAENGSTPGGTFLVARKGKIVYFKSAGNWTAEGNRAYQNDDIYRLASMTKAVTTVAIMQLYERGKLGLDDPIYYYLPAFAKPVILKDFNEADSSFTTAPASRPITIRHLLTHTSGITYGSFNPGKIEAIYSKLGASSFGLSHTFTTLEMVNTIAKVPLIFEPGTQYIYGLNMEVLGGIIEVVSGKPLDQYFKDYIFDPLGMDDTRFYLPKEKHDRIPPIYTYNEKREMITAKRGESPIDPDYPKAFGHHHCAGGGGLSGSTSDYAVFVQALLNGGIYDGKRILSRKSIEVITSDQLITLNKNGKGHSQIPGISFGLGFKLITDEGSAVSHKSPGTFEWGGFFNTKFFIDPKEELIFVGMTQIVPYTRPDFWDKMYAIIYGAIDD